MLQDLQVFEMGTSKAENTEGKGEVPSPVYDKLKAEAVDEEDLHAEVKEHGKDLNDIQK